MSGRSIRGGRRGAGVVSDASGHAAGRAAYFYAVLQIVPRVERGERFNAGIVLFSRARRFLGVRTSLDARKLAALAPGCDGDALRRQLRAMEAVAAGSEDGGPIARLDPAERFHWLTSVSSTVIQPAAVHTGLTDDPAATLDRLFHDLVGDGEAGSSRE